MIKLLEKKEIIQSFIWNCYLSKIDKQDPYEISKFEKEIKKLSYTIQDETLKKYVLEDFLEKIKKLTPIQTSGRNYNYSRFKKRNDFKILNETKALHQKKKDLTKIQIIEFSILFIILKSPEIASERLEELSKIEFISEKNESLKNALISYISEGIDKNSIFTKINPSYKKIVEEINENSNIQIIVHNKSHQDILDLIEDLIQDHNDQSSLKKIESIEKKLINNLDENSYSELIKLKSQLNRD